MTPATLLTAAARARGPWDAAPDPTDPERHVYLSSVARALGTTVEAISGDLLALHRAGAIRLSRADLAGAMDADELAASHICDGLSEYHLLSYHR